MKLLRLLATVFLFLGFSTQGHAEEGGVISGGPNASPSPTDDEGGNGTKKPTTSSGGIFFQGGIPVDKPNEKPTETTTAGKLKPWKLKISEEDFDDLAIRAIKNRSEYIFVNPSVGAMTPHTVDILNRRITGVTEFQLPVELEEIHVPQTPSFPLIPQAGTRSSEHIVDDDH